MKTVIIPSDYHPFVIEVNGVKYTYPEGTEQSVPDEVASAIENYYKLQPKERPADGGVLPYVSGENNGEVLKVEDGTWKKASGGLNESDFVMSGADLTGFSTKDGKVYLPVVPKTGYLIDKIENGSYRLRRNSHLLVRQDASEPNVFFSAAYEPTAIKYVLSLALIESLAETGSGQETIRITGDGVPSTLWNSIVVSMGAAGAGEIKCNRISAESASNGTYQGFIYFPRATALGKGLFSLVVNVTKENQNFTFDFSYAPVSVGGGDSDIYTMHLSYNDDQGTVTVTEDAVDISNAISAGKVLRIAFYARSPDYDYDGNVMPFSYYTDGVYNGVATGIYIALTDPVNWRNCNLSYYNSAWQIQGI